jgi:hypothetical protein
MPMVWTLGNGMTRRSLAELTEMMRNRPMTPAEKDAQLRNFIRGQTGASDPEIDRVLGPPLAERLAAERAAGRLAGLREAADALGDLLNAAGHFKSTRLDEDRVALEAAMGRAAAILALAEKG